MAINHAEYPSPLKGHKLLKYPKNVSGLCRIPPDCLMKFVYFKSFYWIKETELSTCVFIYLREGGIHCCFFTPGPVKLIYYGRAQ